MGDGTKAVPADGIDQDAGLLQASDDCGWTQPVVDHIEDHDIRIDILRVDSYRRDLLQSPRQLLGMVVIHL